MIRIITFISFICSVHLAFGQPDLTKRQIVLDEIIYGDFENPDLYYYSPRGISILRDSDAKPDINVLMLRQVGSNVDERLGHYRFNNIIQVRIGVQYPSSDRIDSIGKDICHRTKDCGSMELRPLPFKRINCSIHVAGDNQESDTIKGVIESSEIEYERWSTRLFTAKLDNIQAQLLEKALQLGQSTVHLNYAISSSVKYKNDGLDVSGGGLIDSSLVKGIKKMVKENTVEVDIEIVSDAILLSADLKRFPDLINKIDVNTSCPPGYAALEVRCYDFSDGEEDAYFMKKVEIEGRGIAGGKISTTVDFKESVPDVQVQNIRFQFAIDLKKPFRYRIVKYFDDKKPEYDPWIERENWNELIDISDRN